MSKPYSDSPTGLKSHIPTDLIDKLRPDRNLSEPIYQQLTRRILGLIESGDIGENSSLPSERVLAEKLDLSRTTVKRCYDKLRTQNCLTSKGRAGSVINAVPRLSPQLGRLKGFSEEMRELGLTPSTRLLEQSILSNRTIASVFGRPSTARFLRLVRLRLGDDVPLSREVAWYDLTAAPDLVDWDASGSIYQFLQAACGIRLVRAEQTIEAVMSTKEEARAFGFAEPAPCLLFKRKTYSGTGQIIEYVEGTFRGDAYVYTINLNIAPTA
ncbi:MAG: GntR family transcriptional regulator [Gammaproteobacteria bacterium]|nr:GntR family transcriptional regulator [Gammaproteobacteria bacterium]